MPYPGVGFPIPPFEWPHVGRQWPAYNVESDQADGLVMWMPYGGGYPGSHQHIDQISGLVFTEGGTPVWIADSEYGWSLLFDDGSNEYLELAFPVVEGTPLSMTCWFNSNDITTWQNLMCVADQTGHYGNCSLNLQGNFAGDPVGARSQPTDDSGTGGAVTTSGYTANTWYHAAGVWTGIASRAAYIDGASKGTNALSRAFPDATHTSIGVLCDTSKSNYMSGRIRDARIYNVAKTDTEIYQIATEPRELFQLPRRLWRLGAVAPPPATIVPVTMHHYRSMRV